MKIGYVTEVVRNRSYDASKLLCAVGPICGVIGGVSNMLDYVMSKKHFYIQFFDGLIVVLSLNRASVEAAALRWMICTYDFAPTLALTKKS